MKKKTFEWVWDDKEQWNSPPPKFGSVYGYASGFKPSLDYIMIKQPVDNPVEAERLYKLNHNRQRAKEEWAFLDRFCNKVYRAYRTLWGLPNEKL